MRLPDPSGHRDVALGLCRGAGGVLLVRNVRSAQGTATPFWDLPGGTVEPGESIRDALAREWREEVGWAPAVGDLLFVSDGAKRTASSAPPLYTWRTFVLAVEAPAFGVMSAPGHEIEAVEWVPESVASMRLGAPYHGPLRDFLAGRGPRLARVDWLEPAPAADTAALPPGIRHLLVLAAAAAVGDAVLVGGEVEAARSAGVPPEVVAEALLQVVPYAGFPRALAAFSAARRGLPADAGRADGEPDPSERAAAGVAAFDAVYGDTAPKVTAGLAALHPLLPVWTKDFAYGRVLARPGLRLLDRELLAVAILTALGGASDALLGHMRAAVRLGASTDAVAAAIALVPPSAGAGRRAAARALLPRL